MSINDAAQTVQRSATPNAYGRHEPSARALAAAVGAATCTPPTPQNAAWIAPVTGRCTSGFGPRNGEFHRGQDVAAPIGTLIVAAHSGRVIDSGPASGYGLWIRIQHPDSVITTYGHNNRNLVTIGQTVHTGQPIAEIGTRGHSTGPHLHFQIESDGQPIDPNTYYQQHNAPPPCSQERASPTP